MRGGTAEWWIFSRQFVVLSVSVFFRWAGLSVGVAGGGEGARRVFCLCLPVGMRGFDCDVDV